jgi:excinuclease UvrABC nuclease subunit
MIGVYYLWDGATVLYVGQSICVEKRIGQHLNTLDFAGYFVDECPAEELNAREAAAIAEFDPPYNHKTNCQP